MLKNQIEIDEKYLNYSHKGTKFKEIKGKKRGTPAEKRGLSDEQVCLLSAVERQGLSVLRSYNLAKPGSEDVLHLAKNIQKHSYIWTDGLASYHHLIEEKECRHKIVKDYKEYDQVNHLNEVNSFHERIEMQYRRYRGVATKYINRYAALFNMQRECRDMDQTECLLYIRKRLRKKRIYFYIRQLSRISIFDIVPNRFVKVQQIAG